MAYGLTAAILVGAVLACGPAQASEWVWLAKTEGVGLYIDVSSIVVKGDIRRAWVKYAPAHRTAPGTALLWHDQFDCSAWAMRGDGGVYQDADGTKQSRDRHVGAWALVEPDTADSTLLHFICAWKPK
jgi:hypothetical protein